MLQNFVFALFVTFVKRTYSVISGTNCAASRCCSGGGCEYQCCTGIDILTGCGGNSCLLYGYCDQRTCSTPTPPIGEYELILRQKDVRITTFSPMVRTNKVENAGTIQADVFTNIGNLNKDNYVASDGYYYFKLIYQNIDETSTELTFKQSSWLTDSSISGYTAINVPSPRSVGGCSEFKGLAFSDRSESFLDGNGNEPCWWNSVGTISKHAGGIPAFDENIAYSTVLYVCPANTECFETKELILSQKDVRTATFNSNVRNTKLENAGDSNADTFTNIGNLNMDDYKFDDNFYYFRLIYNNMDATKTNLLWKQKSWVTDESTSGYTSISVPQQSGDYCADFRGLAFSDRSESLLDGNGNGYCWWNSVGTINTHNGGIPAFGTKLAYGVKLYVYRKNSDIYENVVIGDKPYVPKPYEWINNVTLNSWLIIISALLSIILFIVLLICCKRRIETKTGIRYDSVKYIDSEEFDDSEANPINIDQKL
eukprot:541197_1